MYGSHRDVIYSDGHMALNLTQTSVGSFPLWQDFQQYIGKSQNSGIFPYSACVLFVMSHWPEQVSQPQTEEGRNRVHLLVEEWKSKGPWIQKREEFVPFQATIVRQVKSKIYLEWNRQKLVDKMKRYRVY